MVRRPAVAVESDGTSYDTSEDVDGDSEQVSRGGTVSKLVDDRWKEQ